MRNKTSKPAPKKRKQVLGKTEPKRRNKTKAARDGKPAIEGNPFVDVATGRIQYAERLHEFVKRYVANGGNGTQAAIAAGVAQATAPGWASQALRNPHVYAEIRAKRDRIGEMAGLSEIAVASRLTRAVSYDHRDLLDDEGHTLPPHLVPDSIAVILEGFKYTQWGLEYKLPSRIGALELAMKLLGMFKEHNKQKVDPIKAMLEHIRPFAGSQVVE